MNKIIGLFGLLCGVLFVVAFAMGFSGLIAWGVGNGIIYLFGLSATWTYWQGCVTGMVLYGIGWLFGLLKNDKKGDN